jgi:hypothetical protein
VKKYTLHSIGLRIAILLLAPIALAANQQDFSLFQPATLSGKLLQAGNYQVSWTGSAPNVELKVRSGGKVLATSPAQLVPVDQPYPRGSVLLIPNPDGSMAISEFRFGGKKYRIVVSPSEPMRQ